VEVSEWELQSSSKLSLSQSEIAECTTLVVDCLLRYTIKVQPTIDELILSKLEVVVPEKLETGIDISNHCVAKALSVRSLSIKAG